MHPSHSTGPFSAWSADPADVAQRWHVVQDLTTETITARDLTSGADARFMRLRAVLSE